MVVRVVVVVEAVVEAVVVVVVEMLTLQYTASTKIAPMPLSPPKYMVNKSASTSAAVCRRSNDHTASSAFEFHRVKAIIMLVARFSGRS